MKRVNHSVEFKADDGACTNRAETYLSRLRRSEFGIHHRISGHLVQGYANECVWREDNRRAANGTHGQTRQTPPSHRAMEARDGFDVGRRSRSGQKGRDAVRFRHSSALLNAGTFVLHATLIPSIFRGCGPNIRSASPARRKRWARA
jgi:hypothetical protein